MENKIEKDKEGYLPNYIFLFSIAYLISAFIGAFYFPFMQELDCTFANCLAGLGLFFFFGFLLWPLSVSYTHLDVYKRQLETLPVLDVGAPLANR